MSQFIHPDFKLNGRSYNVLQLRALALEWSKEDTSYKKEIGFFF